MIHSIYLHLLLRQGGHVVCTFENVSSFLLIPLLILHGHVSTDPTMDSQNGEGIISPKKKNLSRVANSHIGITTTTFYWVLNMYQAQKLFD